MRSSGPKVREADRPSLGRGRAQREVSAGKLNEVSMAKHIKHAWLETVDGTKLVVSTHRVVADLIRAW